MARRYYIGPAKDRPPLHPERTSKFVSVPSPQNVAPSQRKKSLTRVASPHVATETVARAPDLIYLDTSIATISGGHSKPLVAVRA